MSYTGMDIPAIQQLGRELNAAANEIQQLFSKLTPQITGAPWVGPDRERIDGPPTAARTTTGRTDPVARTAGTPGRSPAVRAFRL